MKLKLALENCLSKYIFKISTFLFFLLFLGIMIPAASSHANASGTWSYTSSFLQDPRYGFTATTLQNGRVLIEGGFRQGNISTDSEIYDPASGTWTITGSTIYAHAAHTSTLLQDGTVLVSGSVLSNRFLTETYDPQTGVWTSTGEMVNPHFSHTATRLQNGKVLIAGDQDRDVTDLYDPITRTYSFGGVMTTPRSNHIAILLNNGKVLIAGGNGCTCGDSRGAETLSSAELYNPSTGSFISTGSMIVPRNGAGVALLPDGRVLVAGGNLNPARYGGSFDPSTTAEIYDPNTGLWILTGPLHTGRIFFGGHKLISLPDGTVMAAGSDSAGTSEIYDPSTGFWGTPINLRQPQCFGATAPLPNGKALLAGGTDCISLDNKLLIAQVYSPIGQLTELSPTNIWIGLKNSDDVGTRFDLKAEVYKNSTELVSSGQLDNVWGGSSGFNNANLQTIPFNAFTPVDFPEGSTLNIKLYVRNACIGPTHNSGTARLWYDDAAANSRFDATIEGSNSDYYLRNNFVLSAAVGTGPKQKIDVQAGAKCSPFKTFGEWSITP